MAMRVLHVVTYMGRGGLETMIMNYYRRIDRDKVQFDFLVHRDFRADYDDEIECLGGKIYRVSKLIPWSKKYNRELDAFFREHSEYKIVHVHQDCLSSVILKVAKKYNVPVRIAHSHNSNQTKDIRYPVKLFYKRSINRYATDLFSCGKDAGDWMFSGAPYTVINNAIDAKKFAFDFNVRKQIREKFNLTDDDIVIGNVANFSFAKNHSFLIDVFNEMHKEEKIKLLLVGEGPTMMSIRKKVCDLGLNDKVIFAGLCSNVHEIMQGMDIFVMPSLYEGLPLVLVEAQSAGLQCVVSEGVPTDCKITGLVKRISLNIGVSEWAKVILSLVGLERKNMYETIVNKGFDIVSNAKWLQDFYINKSRVDD